MRSVEWMLIVLGILSVVYSIIVARVGSGTGFYLVWLFIGLIFITLFILIRTGIWNRVPQPITVLVKVMAVIILLLFVLVEGFIVRGFFYEGRPDLDYIIVLGAQVREDGPSVVLRYRLDEAYRYLKDDPETICIVSGGQGYNEPCQEAEVMKKYLEDKGIDSSRIIKEERAQNTAENLKYSKDLIGGADPSVGIVTNNFHTFRGVAIARKQGFRDACGIPSGSHPLYLPNNMLREFFGVVKDKLQGNI